MKQLLKAIAKRTPIYQFYRYLAERVRMRRMIRQFRQWSTEDQKRLEFYKQFVSAGSIVFDVGANMGNRAKVFSRLGAVVVAVEPQTPCADFLLSVFQNAPNFHLVKTALGASAGQAEMLISDTHTISSLSPDWVRMVKESGRFADYQWNKKEMVSIDTLDNLIARHGRPTFIKIDVEGFEEQVISGLSTPVAALSMEFTTEFMNSTFRSIDHLCQVGEVRFQMSLGESMEFALPEWTTAEEIKCVLSKLTSTACGDLYARFNVQ
jgi:FkbM family methyltransferase